jgi:hypothetical protein
LPACFFSKDTLSYATKQKVLNIQFEDENRSSSDKLLTSIFTLENVTNLSQKSFFSKNGT